jgi:hypothetical protein
MLPPALPCVFKPAVPRPSHRETPASSASRILRRLSRPRLAALRLATSRCGRQPRRAGEAPGAARGGGGGVKLGTLCHASL